MRKGLIIFAKEPIPGKVKTRLAKGLGDEKAAAVYEAVMSHTFAEIHKLEGIEIYIYKTKGSSLDYFKYLFNIPIKIFDQKGENLGERMKTSFGRSFDYGVDQIVIIGTDCPQINAEIILEAFEKLECNDVVIGPANDGGYYLLGLKKLKTTLFEKIKWSTDEVYEKTIKKIKKAKLSYFEFEKLIDIDTRGDLTKFLKKSENKELNSKIKLIIGG